MVGLWSSLLAVGAGRVRSGGVRGGWRLIQVQWSYFYLLSISRSRCQGKIMLCFFRILTNSIPILVTITKFGVKRDRYIFVPNSMAKMRVLGQ